MATISKTFRLDENMIKDIEIIAQENSMTVTQVMENSLKLYRDYAYMQDKASVINQDILNVVKSGNRYLERSINHKTNSFLSELAIQTAITNLILAKSLNISTKEINTFRIQAVGFLKEKQRILRMDDLVDE